MSYVCEPEPHLIGHLYEPDRRCQNGSANLLTAATAHYRVSPDACSDSFRAIRGRHIFLTEAYVTLEYCRQQPRYKCRPKNEHHAGQHPTCKRFPTGSRESLISPLRQVIYRYNRRRRTNDRADANPPSTAKTSLLPLFHVTSNLLSTLEPPFGSTNEGVGYRRWLRLFPFRFSLGIFVQQSIRCQPLPAAANDTNVNTHKVPTLHL